MGCPLVPLTPKGGRHHQQILRGLRLHPLTLRPKITYLQVCRYSCQQTSRKLLTRAVLSAGLDSWLAECQPNYTHPPVTPSTSTKHGGTRVEWRRILWQLRSGDEDREQKMFSISFSSPLLVLALLRYSAVNGGSVSIDRQGLEASACCALSAHTNFGCAGISGAATPQGSPLASAHPKQRFPTTIPSPLQFLLYF